MFLRSKYVPTAPISVAMLPNTISQITAPPSMLAMRQPINNPGIAAGVKYGIPGISRVLLSA